MLGLPLQNALEAAIGSALLLGLHLLEVAPLTVKGCLPLRNADTGQSNGRSGALDTRLEASTVAKAKPSGWLRAVAQMKQQRCALLRPWHTQNNYPH